MTSTLPKPGFQTTSIHSHQFPDPVTGAVITPIYQTSTFAQEDAGVNKGYDYTRCGNPTQTVLEGVLADIEGGQFGLAFSTGIGALTTMMFALFRPGDHLVISDNVYGGTYRFLSLVFQQFNIDVQYVDMTDINAVAAAIKPNTKLLYMESPTNPLLKLVDIEAVVGLAKNADHKIYTAIDNTFASPFLQQPLSMGVDIVMQSTTKYIAGHSDLLGGGLIVNDQKLRDTLYFHQKTLGATPDPFAAWLTLRGVKTLGVRMERHCKNAMAVAQFLEQHPKIDQVIYPGLPSHPQHALAKRQMKDFGGMISVRVKGGEQEARKLMKGLKYFTLAESLGGVESLIEHPAIMTHASMTPEDRAAIGITDNFVRMSIGIEDVDDLIADLSQSLAQL